MGHCDMCYESTWDCNDLDCGHTVCSQCLKEYIKSGIKHGIGFFDCPINIDHEVISDDILRNIISERKFAKILHSRNSNFGVLMCPNCLIVCKKDCDDESAMFYCESCNTIYCNFCREEQYSWHDYCNCRYEDDIDDDIISNFHDIKRCPVCKVLIFREEGCNSMRCTYCKVKFCWECCKTKSKIDQVGHNCKSFGDFIQTHSDDEYVDGYDDGETIYHPT